LKASQKLGVKETEVSIPDKKLSKEEIKKIGILSNKHSGEWDMDILQKEFEETINSLGFNELLNDDESLYTREIKVPIYEPSGEKPEISQLVNKEKSSKIIEEIEKMDIDNDIKDFLRVSAYRHNIFNYAKIADYYSLASEEIKDTMRSLALVIVDYERAIEEGFVEFVSDIMDIQDNDNEE